MGNVTREELLQLMKEKENLEKDIVALSEVLKSQGVGMDEPLVDDEGFPRADIDVYQVRHARHGIRTKTTDLKEMMKKIEAGLANIHAQARQGVGIETDISNGLTLSNVASEKERSPFARVLVVCPGSPAADAGIQQNDLITQFGSVDNSNFSSLKSISDVVEHSKDKPLAVWLLRNDQHLKVELTPRTWSGQGLLGFKIRPVSAQPDR